MKALSIVIPVFNEAENLEHTLKSIRETEGCPVDLIVVDDHSEDSYPYGQLVTEYNIRLIENEKRIGPAMCREKGIREVTTPYLLTIDGHMQFHDDDWCGKITGCLEENDRRICCCQTEVLDQNWNVEKRALTYGAEIQFKGSAEKVLEPVWMRQDSQPALSLTEIPCVLGATYFTSKCYWHYLRGLEGLKLYGCEEPYISIKAWLEGGGCHLLKSVVIGHIYRDVLPFSVPYDRFLYNKLLIAELLLPVWLKREIYEKLERNYPREFKEAKSCLIQESSQIKELKKYYLSTFKGNAEDYLSQNNI